MARFTTLDFLKTTNFFPRYEWVMKLYYVYLSSEIVYDNCSKSLHLCRR